MNLVIKLSGKVLEDSHLERGICAQIGELCRAGHRLLLVHGAGKQLTALSRRLGIPVIQREGRRITDAPTLEAAKMVFSAVNRDLVALLVSLDLPAVGLTAADAGIARAVRRPPLLVKDEDGVARPVDFGLVGEIRHVNDERLQQILGLGLLPVVCSLCADDSGQILNINADTLACEFAVALTADRLLSISDVDGIYLDPQDESTLVGRMSRDEALAGIEQGRFTAGMIPKVQAALKALDNGVAVFQVASGVRTGGLIAAVERDAGTLLTP